jgi:resuscitation-promoting factor RpfC
VRPSLRRLSGAAAAGFFLAAGYLLTSPGHAPAQAATKAPARAGATAAWSPADPQALRDAATTRAVLAAKALAALPPLTYEVRPGATLSSIAGHACRPSWWPELWWANRAHIHNPDVLVIHQILRLPACGTVSPAHAAAAIAAIPPPPPPPPPAPVAVSVPPAPAPAAPVVSAPAAGGGVSPSSGYEACVIAAESGGNAGAVNASSGAGGLYQFLPSTWASLGYSGLPQNASPAEQQAAFNQLYAQSGSAPWSSDGC